MAAVRAGRSTATTAVRGSRVLGRTVRQLTSDGYLHKTEIPTYQFQKSLPQLPLPKLEKTLERYLKSVQPLVSEDQYAKTKALVDEFRSGVGAELHKELAAENKGSGTSYIAKPWYEMYMNYRDALPINMNPQLTFKDDPDTAKQQQAARTASLIHASVAFYRTLRDKQLKPDLYETNEKRSRHPWFTKLVNGAPDKLSWAIGFLAGAYALDMSQYNRLFASTRVPCPGTDKHVTYPESQARHVVVQYGHEFFAVPVLKEDGTAVPEAELHAAIQQIATQPPNTSCAPLGAATTLNRDTWAALRQELIQNNKNKTALEMIDSALFAVSLEHREAGPAPMTELENISDSQWVDLLRCMLHGDGRNRWFDKSFQLIVTKNAKASVNFEHGWGDGVAVLRYVNEVYEESTKTPSPAPQAGVQPQRLDFEFTDSVTQQLNKAATEFDAFANSVDCKLLQTQAMNTDLLKKLKLGADGTLQMAFQLAYYRLFGENASTYESASTAGFRHGRTETIRSCTPESDKFVKAFCDPNATLEERDKLMRAAIKNHAQISKDGLLGGGWDRHLFALRELAQRKGLPVPAIFEDAAYQKLGHIIISTSTLASPALDAGGFGPVNKDCYGIGYGIVDIGARFILMTYHLQSDEFLASLDKAMHDMVKVASGENF